MRKNKRINKVRQQDYINLLQGSGFFDSIKQKLSGVVDKFLPMRQAGVLPPDIRKWLEQNGNKLVKSMTIIRVPVASYVNIMLQALTLGKFKQALNKLGYDKALHLRLQFTLDDNSQWYIEKNEVISLSKYTGKAKEQEDMPVSVYGGNLTMNEILNNTREFMGNENFSRYSSDKLNCQNFILSILQANKLLNQEYKDFILQDAEAIFQNLPSYARVASQKITDFAARVNRFIKGEGKRKQNKMSLNNNNTMRKSNPWLNHVANVRSQNPNMSYKDVLVKAKASYKSQKGGQIASPQEVANTLIKKRRQDEEQVRLALNNMKKQLGLGVVLAGRNAPLRRRILPQPEPSKMPEPAVAVEQKAQGLSMAGRGKVGLAPALYPAMTPPSVSTTQRPTASMVKGTNNYKSEGIKLPISKTAYPNLGMYL
jgi:hypothetical protein